MLGRLCPSRGMQCNKHGSKYHKYRGCLSTMVTIVLCAAFVNEGEAEINHRSQADTIQEWRVQENGPHFDTTAPTNVTGLVGKTVHLLCRVRNLGNRTVSWVRHRDIHLLTVGRYTYTSDQRFESLHRPLSDEWVLKIRYPQSVDSGIYECQVSTTPPIGHSVHLVVVDLELLLRDPDDDDDNDDESGDEDGVVDGNNNNNNNVDDDDLGEEEDDDELIVVDDNDQGHEGDDEAENDSGVGTASEMEMDIELDDNGDRDDRNDHHAEDDEIVDVGEEGFPPPQAYEARVPGANAEEDQASEIEEPITEIAGGADLFIDKGSTINLTCLVKNAPEPPRAMIWEHNRQAINFDSSRGGISLVTEKGPVTSSRLLIQKAIQRDSGLYTCSPSNAHPNSVRVHILNEEHPAAMHHGSGDRMAGRLLLVVFLLKMIF